METKDDVYKTYAEFWPFYLQQHSKAKTRNLHYVGTVFTLLFLYTTLITAEPLWILMIPTSGYGFAWAAHFLVEKNRPATFTYPFWSLLSDFRMFFLFIIGKLNPELQKAGIPLA